MLTILRAAKGGAGTTSTAALMACAARHPVLLVDLAAELDLVVGAPPSDRPGVLDWLASNAPLEHLGDLLVPLGLRRDTVTMLLPTRGQSGAMAESGSVTVTRWMQLASWCRSWATRNRGSVVVDAGTGAPADLADEFVAACDESWLITRRCYLSLTKAQRCGLRPNGVIVVDEPGRSLTTRDIEQAMGAPVVATIPWHPAVARSVDSGIARSPRLPRSIRRALPVLGRSNSAGSGDVRSRRSADARPAADGNGAVA